jgi:dephospho-CoA kinase
MKIEARLIGLTGTNGSGKTEAAEFFQKKGFARFSLSDEIREELSRRGEAPSRNNMIRMGNELRERFGADVLARRLLDKISGRAVVDSIRNPEEVRFLRKRQGFILLALDAPLELRYHRITLRGRDESVSTLEAFAAKEREEMAGTANGQRLKACLEMADVLIVNDGSLADLTRKLEAFL